MGKTMEERKQCEACEAREERLDFSWAPFYEELAAGLASRFRKEPGQPGSPLARTARCGRLRHGLGR